MLLKELIQLNERMTSPHVMSRSDITVITNVLKKEFGLDKDIQNGIGLCMASQVVFSIAATGLVDEDDLGKFLRDHIRDYNTTNNLGKLIDLFNKNPIKSKDKYIRFTLNAHAITSAEEMRKELKTGQPIVCAVPSGGTLDELIEDMSSLSKNKDFIPQFLALKNRHGDPSLYEDALRDLKNGFVSKNLFDIALKTSHDNKNNYAYHSSLCFGYEAGDNAFLFREPRPAYGRNGYYKVAQELFTEKNLGMKKDLIHGMFYVEVIDKKEVPAP
jgi:hypothetical protein